MNLIFNMHRTCDETKRTKYKFETSFDLNNLNKEYDIKFVLWEILIIVFKRFDVDECMELQYNNHCFAISSEELEDTTIKTLYEKLKNEEFSQSSKKKNGVIVTFDYEGNDKKIDNSDIRVFTDANKIVFESFKYNKTILKNFADCVCCLVDNYVEKLDENVLKTNILCGETRTSIMKMCNKHKKYNFDKPIYELFEEQVLNSPENVAYRYVSARGENENITYRELNRKSSVLANKLQRSGVQKDVVVGVYMSRSINTLISILAIFKAGGIYLPLDKSYPKEYLQTILEEVEPHTILLDEEIEYTGSKIIDIRTEKYTETESYIKRNTIEDTALIMYTSGSTGKPKGVKHKQIQVLNRIFFMWEKYPFNEKDVLAQRTTLNYMPSMWELFGALLHGNLTVIFSDEVVLDPYIFLKELSINNISYVTLVPTLFKMMSSNKKFSEYTSKIKVWTFCGEPITDEVIKTFKEKVNESIMINDYGSTETNGILYYEILSDSRESNAFFEIIPNVEFYILDDFFNPVPFEMVGTIYIGGEVVSTGYVSEEEGKQKFVNITINGENKRLIKVGDLAIIHSNHEIELIGREDNQIKIRGRRVDIDGIELVIKDIDCIKDAVVVCQNRGNKYCFLKAYITIEASGVSIEEIREILINKLPDFMIPSEIEIIDKIPLLANGKINRKMLENKKKDQKRMFDENELISMVNDIASSILEIESDINNCEKKFYEIGFDSASIVEFLNKLNETFEIELSLSDLYDNSTIYDICRNCIEKCKVSVNRADNEHKQNTETNNESNESIHALKELISDITKIPMEDLDENAVWAEIGLDLNDLRLFTEAVIEKFKVEFTINDLKEAECISALEKELAKRVIEEENINQSVRKTDNEVSEKKENREKVAVVGIACKYAGADDIDEYWNNIFYGKDCITTIPESRWEFRNCEQTSKFKWGGFCRGIEYFDNEYFNISEQEAIVMDPQQRICLEEVIHAVEDSGYSISDLEGQNVGVFIGGRQGDYYKTVEENGMGCRPYSFMGSDTAILSARISYLFNLKGPCMTIDTACSSSMSAICEAVDSLRLHNCDAAIAGGVFIMNTNWLHINSANMGMLSPEGKCKTLDDSADGFVPGEGAGILILKRYEDALKDGDRIYGIVIGSGINQDGRTNGITAPSMESQYELEKRIYNEEKINPETISYVEAHGTGTKLGDPIELEALTKSFREWTEKKGYCAIGSVKTNIGHTIAASGVASMVKVLLCLNKEVIPKSLNYKKGNEYIDIAETPFYVSDKTKEWRGIDGIRRAAISSFGFGGTNCHVVVEGEQNTRQINLGGEYFFPISAKSEECLKEKIVRLREWLEKNRETEIGDISYSLTSIEKYSYRTALYASNIKELISGLKEESLEIEYCRNNNIVISENEYDNSFEKLKELYLGGADLRLRKYYSSKGCKIISLPVYPFSKKKFYFDKEKKQYEVNDLLKRYNAYDHVVNDEVTIPGAAYIDFMSISNEKEANIVENIAFYKKLGVAEREKCLEVSIDENKSYRTIEIRTNEDEKQPMVASAKFLFSKVDQCREFDLKELLQHMNSVLYKEECHKRFNNIGLNYGRGYSVINKISYNSEEAISELMPVGEQEYNINPIVLDAAFQTVIPFINQEYEKRETFIPSGVDRIIIKGELNRARFAYAIKGKENLQTGFQKYDIYILDSIGNELCCIQGFTRSKSSKKEKISTFKERFIFKELNNTREFFEDWIIYWGLERTGGNRKIINNGRKTILVYFGEKYEKIGENEYKICVDNLNSILMLFENLKGEGKNVKKIIYLGAYLDVVNSYENNIKYSVFSVVNIINAYEKIEKRNALELIVFMDGSTEKSIYYSALDGFAKCLEKEYSRISLRVCDLCGYEFGSEQFITIIKNEISASQDEHFIKYENGRRLVKEYVEFNIFKSMGERIKNDGVYIIVGGAGGIGSHLAKYLNAQYGCNLVSIGRKEQLSIEENYCGEYVSADICDEEQIGRAIEKIKNKYGKINGVFHCAGVNKDKLLINKAEEDIKNVISSKTIGLLNICNVLKNNEVDFILCFSSVAAVLGNVGQCDYAYANAFMDEFSRKIDNVYSINWGLWKNGNMGNIKNIVEKMEDEFGIIPIEDTEGFNLMMEILNSGEKNIVALKKKMTKLNSQNDKSSNKRIDELKNEILNIAKKSFNITDLEEEKSFSDMELDSIGIMEFARTLSQAYDVSISTATILEFDSVEKIANHIISEIYNDYSEENDDFILKETDNISHENNNIDYLDDSYRNNDIAIVGVSGRFPKAENIDELWENISFGNNCIGEIPIGRIYSDRNRDNTNEYARYAGLLNSVELFDADYFNIPSKEAEMMDPQQRMLLEETIRCIESSNEKLDSLKGKKIDVFISALSNDYDTVIRKSENPNDPSVISGNDMSMLANRISYFLDLKGESIVINAACSGTIVCIKKAIENLRNHTSEGAIIGAVNIILDENGIERVGNLGLLSKERFIKSFSEEADGYVRGEGVGVIAIKPLKNALEDKNQILAVIKGCAVNHGGRGHYLMEPNSIAQAEVIKEAIREANVPIDTISYVECHGTGTQIGDANEIYALKKAFKELYEAEGLKERERACALSTIKPNIGHLEAASGMASIIKAIMALKNNKIPQMLIHGQIKTEYNLNDSTFYVADKMYDWKPLLGRDGDEIPRRVCVNAYSFGGTNAHLVLEEYKEEYVQEINEARKLIFPFSAKNENALKNYLKDFLEYLEKTDGGEICKIANTLQDRRQHYKERIAIIADSKEELINLIKKYQNHENAKDIVIKTTAELSMLTSSLFKGDESEIVSFMKSRGNLYGIAFLWVNDIDIQFCDISDQYSRNYTRIPAYVFDRKPYWVKINKSQKECILEENIDNRTGEINETALAKIISDYCEVNYEKLLKENDFKKLDISSLMLTKIKYQIESTYHIRIAMRELVEISNLKELAELLKNKVSEREQ